MKKVYKKVLYVSKQALQLNPMFGNTVGVMQASPDQGASQVDNMGETAMLNMPFYDAVYWCDDAQVQGPFACEDATCAGCLGRDLEPVRSLEECSRLVAASTTPAGVALTWQGLNFNGASTSGGHPPGCSGFHGTDGGTSGGYASLTTEFVTQVDDYGESTLLSRSP